MRSGLGLASGLAYVCYFYTSWSCHSSFSQHIIIFQPNPNPNPNPYPNPNPKSRLISQRILVFWNPSEFYYTTQASTPYSNPNRNPNRNPNPNYITGVNRKKAKKRRRVDKLAKIVQNDFLRPGVFSRVYLIQHAFTLKCLALSPSLEGHTTAGWAHALIEDLTALSVHLYSKVRIRAQSWF